MALATVARHPHTKKLHFLLEPEKAIELASANGEAKLLREAAAAGEGAEDVGGGR